MRLRDEFGSNVLGLQRGKTWYKIAFEAIAHPFNGILAVIAIVSGIMEDYKTLGVMIAIILLGLIIRVVQEVRANAEAEALKSMVSSKVIVYRAPEGTDLEKDPKGVSTVRRCIVYHMDSRCR